MKAIIGRLAEIPSMPIHDIADFVENLRTAKFDQHVPAPLLRRLWARANERTASEIHNQAKSLLTGQR